MKGSVVDFGPVPVVLAFAPDETLGAHDAAALHTIRAELRGLGAVLVVLSRAGIWSLSPDDDFERLERNGLDHAAETARLADRHGVAWSAAPSKEQTRASSTVFVLDAQGSVRFSSVHAPDRGELGAVLALALGAAGRELAKRPAGRTMVSRRELVTASLVAGFVLAFVDGCASRPPAREAAPALTTKHEAGTAAPRTGARSRSSSASTAPRERFASSRVFLFSMR